MRVDILQHAVRELRALEVELIEADRLDLFKMNVFVEEVACHTAACFVGWAGIQGWFEQFGLKIRFEPRNNIGPIFQVPIYCLAGVAERDTREFCGFLGLERIRTIDALIDPDEYDLESDKITPSVVADRIEKLIELGETDFLDDLQIED